MLCDELKIPMARDELKKTMPRDEKKLHAWLRLFSAKREELMCKVLPIEDGTLSISKCISS
jgi:hypothetical protein